MCHMTLQVGETLSAALRLPSFFLFFRTTPPGGLRGKKQKERDRKQHQPVTEARAHGIAVVVPVLAFFFVFR